MRFNGERAEQSLITARRNKAADKGTRKMKKLTPLFYGF